MIKLEQQRAFILAAVLAATIMALGIGQAVLQREAEAQGSSVTAPMYEVDPLWPSRCPITGCSAGPSAPGSTSRTTCGSSIAAPAAA